MVRSMEEVRQKGLMLRRVTFEKDTGATAVLHRKASNQKFVSTQAFCNKHTANFSSTGRLQLPL